MSEYDYSGVGDHGRRFGTVGWRMFSVGILFALCPVAYVGAIVVVVVTFAWTMGQFGS